MLNKFKKAATSQIVETLDEVQHLTEAAETAVEKEVAPIRESILKRFPTLFLLAVTFGVTAVISSLEQLLEKYDLLQDSPWLLLFIGVGTLAFTGKLYKKLG